MDEFRQVIHESFRGRVAAQGMQVVAFSVIRSAVTAGVIWSSGYFGIILLCAVARGNVNVRMLLPIVAVLFIVFFILRVFVHLVGSSVIVDASHMIVADHLTDRHVVPLEAIASVQIVSHERMFVSYCFELPSSTPKIICVTCKYDSVQIDRLTKHLERQNIQVAQIEGIKAGKGVEKENTHSSWW